MTTELLQLNSSVLFGHGGDLQDVVHRQQLGQEGSHRILEPLHQIKVRHGQQSAEVLKAVHLWKSNPVHEVDDGAEDIVGALLHIDNVFPLPHPCVQCSLEVIGPESNRDSLVTRNTHPPKRRTRTFFLEKHKPQVEDERVRQNCFALAGESYISLSPIVPELGYLGHQLRTGNVHPERQC